MTTTPTCVGSDSCTSTPRFIVLGPEKDPKERPTCGRHLATVIDYATVPGRRVTVTRVC